MIESASGVFAAAANDRREPDAGAELEREPEHPAEHVAERGADEEERRHLASEEARARA